MGKYNIYHRKDGRWEGRILIKKDNYDKRKYKYIFGKTREFVERTIDKYREKMSNNLCNKTYEDIYIEWFESIQHSIKESTAANYTLKAKKHILPEFGNTNICEIKSERINDFIGKKTQEGLSGRYITDILVLMKSVYKYAANVYRIANPMDLVFTPKCKKTEITLLDDSEQQILENYISLNKNNTTMGIAISMATGIRIGELCALQWNDIDFKKRILTVKKTMQRIQTSDAKHKTKLTITSPKSESSKRCIPIPDCLISLLQNHKGAQEEYIVSGNRKPIEPRTMQYRFAKILKNVNLPSIHYHALRHIFASNCVKLGFDIKVLSELMGHSSVRITLDRYVHTSIDDKRKNMNLMRFDFE